MRNHVLTLCALAVTGLAASACSTSSPADLPPGKYERTTTSVNSNGTEVTRKASTDVSVDRYGNKSATVKSKTTQDPQGLFNKKTTSETESTYEEDR
ncbi:MAG: hypothetical protein JWO78_966 [Micavibrio sp.]|nr:hypothetical protein [Micavibrio sp.]